MTQHAFTRAILERDLRAKSQVARFALLQTAEHYVQTTLPVAPVTAVATKDAPAECDHAGTGREPQKRLLSPGFDEICARCGAVTKG